MKTKDRECFINAKESFFDNFKYGQVKLQLKTYSPKYFDKKKAFVEVWGNDDYGLIKGFVDLGEARLLYRKLQKKHTYGDGITVQELKTLGFEEF